MKTDPDLRLAGKARRGDRKSLAALYERYRGRLFGFLLRSTGERARAEDLFQEVWMKVIESIDRFHPERGTFRAWLFRVAANAAVDEVRRQAVRRGPELDAPVSEEGPPMVDLLASGEPGPEREGTSREAGRDLARALEALPPAHRTAVLLRHQQGLSYAELSAALVVPEGTARSWVHRGVLALRQSMEDWSDA